jgi:kynurenine formamidase
MSVARQLVDLSHLVADGTVTYPGLPAPVIRDHLSREASRARYAPGTEFHIGRIDMIGNTGTYVDAPFHRFPDGPDLGDLALEALADLDGLVVRRGNRPGRAIDEDGLATLALQGRAVLFHTGWDRHWGTAAYGTGHPFLTRGAAEQLIRGGVRLVGIDSLNVDDDQDGTRPVHTTLLRAGIPIVEHLCGLDRLPDSGFRFFAVPPRVRGLGSFPVRAFAAISGAAS